MQKHALKEWNEMNKTKKILNDKESYVHNNKAKTTYVMDGRGHRYTWTQHMHIGCKIKIGMKTVVPEPKHQLHDVCDCLCLSVYEIKLFGRIGRHVLSIHYVDCLESR